MYLTAREVLETMEMFEEQHLDVRTITLGVNLSDCASETMEGCLRRIATKLLRKAENMVETAEAVSRDFGIPIVNKRLSVTPISLVAGSTGAHSYVPVARTLDRVAAELGIDYLGGFSAPVHKGITPADRVLLESLPEALAATERVCSSISAASTKAGINMEALQIMGRVLHRTAHMHPERLGVDLGRLVVFCNQPEDNPFIAGAMHGVGEADCAINVGVSGPGVVKSVVDRNPDTPLHELAECIKETAFKITRMGELAGREMARRLGVPFGIVDLSLAPTPTRGDSVAEVLESMGLEKCGTHGTTAALALLNDAVKRGGVMASSRVGGLSGAFIPLSEDLEMARSADMGALSLDKLEAMTSVCSVGLDMVAVPGDTPPETLTAIMADEMAIGMVNGKTTAARLLPVPGRKAGEWVDFGGLLGRAPIIEVKPFSARNFVNRGGRIPAPVQSLTN